MYKKIAAIILVLAVASILAAFSLPQNNFHSQSSASRAYHAEFKKRPGYFTDYCMLAKEASFARPNFALVPS
ncbi:MAG: hypothetical protein ACP5O3_01860 [Candidatus Micrarchaeia archaeon]